MTCTYQVSLMSVSWYKTWNRRMYTHK